MSQTHVAPWGMRLASERLFLPSSSFASVDLDGDSQIAVYRDGSGAIIEMGKHGTNRSRATNSMSSGGGDGQEEQIQVQDDSVTDYESD
ncbi:putative ATP-grasp-modified RiPP [Spiractinospora alimapuensis]|uniref:putative ATP-grasp-modified RiPP n=1 Tax=Spiractinospora alimapuensis TaxID=2820884 RepID=UPI001F218D27|nr:putative ATP-grasp-modified RiPP [Spiractinospora alimapuensis]QVQ50106.1 putative ATP-grasp-modified RiPP [Spiractinospora alimapuensis]